MQEIDGYAKYIATRPRAERMGEHGLFGDEDAVDLNAAMAEVNSYTGNIWTHIISLRREDAERLGFDHADAWRALLRAHRNDIAEAMHIPPEDFRWYAAFHDEGGHPHVHMMAWSKKPGQAYLNRDGIRKIKSVLTNQIFQQELLHIYEDKSQSRDELVRETRSAMLALAQKMQNSACEHPEAEQMIWELALELGSVKGKKSYGYLPKDLKQKVDAIVDQMELLPSVYECYGRWWKLQCRLNDFYAEKERQRPPLSQQKEFRQIKNAVLQVAEQVRQNEITFEDVGAEQDAEQNATYSIPYPVRAWYGVATDETLPLEERDEAAKQLEALADGGDRYAQYLTGILYRDGGLLIPDAEKAQHYLGLAAQQDHAAAQYALGRLLLSDDPEVQNPAQGLLLAGTGSAERKRLRRLPAGQGISQRKERTEKSERAAEYVRMAAEWGNPYAQYLLGKLYLSGDGVPQDKDAAYDWFQKAQAQGHDYAGFLWTASSGRSRRTFCSRQRGCSTTWERSFRAARLRRKMRCPDRPQTPRQAASDAYRRRT
ncbi:MAG: MobP3 family relaxase [Oscillospiraceae bacterium]